MHAVPAVACFTADCGKNKCSGKSAAICGTIGQFTYVDDPWLHWFKFKVTGCDLGRKDGFIWLNKVWFQPS